MNTKNFTSLVYLASLDIGATVNIIRNPDVTPNFWSADLTYKYNNIYIICNRDGYWAFAAKLDYAHCHIEFSDCSELSNTFLLKYSINILKRKQLLSDYKRNEINNISDIQYWKPNNYGEVLFNWWD